MTDHQKDQVLDHFRHYMTPEQRRRLMAELPQAYNALVERDIVQVVHIADPERVVTP